jgi:hypothetical protein
MPPFLSVVVPVWNRRELIRPCLSSILAQDFHDFEVIVVDDGSDDGTPEEVLRLGDSRITLVRNKERRGVCAARNRGTALAAGQWLLFVDSDWEMCLGCFSVIVEMAKTAPAEVGVIGGRTRTDLGETWPVAPLPTGTFGFEQYVRWAAACADGPSDWLQCYRREIFETVSWPTDMRFESQFHLRVAGRWKYLACDDILSVENTASPNRLTTDVSPAGLLRRMAAAADQAAMFTEIIEEFGPDLMRFAPRMYENYLYQAALHLFLTGNRHAGVRYAVALLRLKPWAFNVHGLMVLGLLGPRTLLSVKRAPAMKSLNQWVRKIFFR